MWIPWHFPYNTFKSFFVKVPLNSSVSSLCRMLYHFPNYSQHTFYKRTSLLHACGVFLLLHPADNRTRLWTSFGQWIMGRSDRACSKKESQESLCVSVMFLAVFCIHKFIFSMRSIPSLSIPQWLRHEEWSWTELSRAGADLQESWNMSKK